MREITFEFMLEERKDSLSGEEEIAHFGLWSMFCNGIWFVQQSGCIFKFYLSVTISKSRDFIYLKNLHFWLVFTKRRPGRSRYLSCHQLTRAENCLCHWNKAFSLYCVMTLTWPILSIYLPGPYELEKVTWADKENQTHKHVDNSNWSLATVKCLTS